jgi:modified peptide precursor CbpA
MAKGFDAPLRPVETLFLLSSYPRRTRMNKKHETRAKDQNDVIAYRKSCDADGVGLSHYILLKPEELKKAQGARA